MLGEHGNGSPGQRDRQLVLIVGPESATRDDLARGLIEAGDPAIMCSGPPGCVLLREDHCVLVDKADATVIMPSHASSRDVRTTLTLCASCARNPIVVDPSVVDASAPATHVQGDAAEVLRAVHRVLAASSGHRAVADVADIWL